MLIKLKKRSNLDHPLDITMSADYTEAIRSQQFSQYRDSPLSEDGIEYLNMVSMMKTKWTP